MQIAIQKLFYKYDKKNTEYHNTRCPFMTRPYLSNLGSLIGLKSGESLENLGAVILGAACT